MSLFIVFENIGTCYWTSSVLKPNHSVIFWPAEAFGILERFLRLETQLGSSYLVEASGIDTTDYRGDELSLSSLWECNPRLYFSIYYFYQLKYKITFCTTPNIGLLSATSSYANAGWLEREAAEMLGLFFYSSYDGRNLLLDYASTSTPMSRLYPGVGEFELFYNPLEEEVGNYLLNSAEL